MYGVWCVFLVSVWYVITVSGLVCDVWYGVWLLLWCDEWYLVTSLVRFLEFGLVWYLVCCLILCLVARSCVWSSVVSGHWFWSGV